MKQLLVKKQTNAGQTSAESEENWVSGLPLFPLSLWKIDTQTTYAPLSTLKPFFILYFNIPVVRMKQYFCLKNAIK